MTIDEAIVHEREVAEIHRNDIVSKEDYHNMPWIDKKNELNMRSAEEHEQIAEWLEELKLLKEEKKEFQIIARDNYEIGYEKAIDEFVKMCDEAKVCETYYCVSMGEIRYIAEQLKEGVSNEFI